MAKITNFKDRIVDLTGALIGEDDTDAIEQFILDGCYDVINKLKRTDDYDVHKFVVASSEIVDNTAFDTDNVRDIEDVERNGLPCRRIDNKMRSFAANASSIYLATANDPVWYIFNNTILILPVSTGSEGTYIYYIPEYAVTSLSSSTSSIDKFPNQYYEHVLLYASFMILGRQLLNLIQDTTDATDLSLDMISQMMNADKPDDGGDIWDYLRDEDTEMAQATMAAIQGSVCITKTKYDWYKDRMMALRAEYMSKFNFKAPAQGGSA